MTDGSGIFDLSVLLFENDVSHHFFIFCFKECDPGIGVRVVVTDA
jgi:hypothetical protein